MGVALRRALRPGCALLGLLVLSGCYNTGDFGRPRYDWVDDAFHAVAPVPEPEVVGAISAFPFTDEERHLRKLANLLLKPPEEEARWAVTPTIRYRPGARPPVFDRGLYTDNLTQGQFRSATSRYARLIDDIRSDIQRMDPFFRAAHQVADMDEKRARSLGYVATASGYERHNVHLRISENRAVVATVHEVLRERADTYRFALERLVLALPSPMAVEAERAWTELDRRVSAVRVIAVVVAAAPPGAVANGVAVVGPVSK